MENLIKERKINLGTVNGWGKKENDLFQELSQLKIKGSENNKEISNCYYEHSFDVKIENQIVNVIYRVDSGD